MDTQIKTRHTNELMVIDREYLPEILICFSHLRWDIVHQRPHHIMAGLSEHFMTYVIEDPVFDASYEAHYTVSCRDNVFVLVPHLPICSTKQKEVWLLQTLLDSFIEGMETDNIAFWYYNLRAMAYSAHVHPGLVVFDCMHDLPGKGLAPRDLKEYETMLMQRADIVFTGTKEIFNGKKDIHINTHFFPTPPFYRSEPIFEPRVYWEQTAMEMLDEMKKTRQKMASFEEIMLQSLL